MIFVIGDCALSNIDQMAFHDPSAPVAGSRRRHSFHAAWALLCALLTFLIMTGAAGTWAAQPTEPKKGAEAPIDIAATLDEARKQIKAVQKSIKDPQEDAALVKLRATAMAAQAQAEAAVVAITPNIASVQARLAQLGVPGPDSAPEEPDIAAQRKELAQNSSELDAQIKLARLLSVEAGQAADQISALRRTQFQARLGTRAGSILTESFWAEWRREWPTDVRRLNPLRSELKIAAAATPLAAWAGIALAILMVLMSRALARRALMRLTTTRVPPGRLRRSLYAVTQVLLAVAVPAIIARLLYAGISWTGPVSVDMESMMGWLVSIVGYGGLLAGLGHALLAPDRPSWRLTALPDPVAQALRWHPLALSVVIVVGALAGRLATQVNASLVATVVLDCVMVLVVSAVVALALVRAKRSRHALPRSLWVRAGLRVIWAVLAIGVLSALLGYVALGNFIVKQMIWVIAVLCSAYLLTVLIHDGGVSLLASVRRNAGDENLHRPLTRARSQAVVLLSGMGRLIVALIALMFFLAPFGEGPTEVFRQLDYLYSGVTIGEVQIRPTTVMQSIVVLILAVGCVKVLQRWLADQYLPTTNLDPGMRVSTATLFGYAGYVLAVALTLSAAGIGLDRVAWVVSALSVGIGFGLQAVVQNFVSGLILLAERPVKVGDWVSLSGVEGDIRRINVRATEIQMGDRSTVIVPNSEFITKIVRNVTLANPMGLVQIKLPMPRSTDPARVHDMMLAAFDDHADVLDEPAPKIELDSVTGEHLIFNATAYVNSPRAAYGVRSALLFDMLQRLRAAGLLS